MISVVMGVYREAEEDLRKSIESILKQDFGVFEFIIILDDPDNVELEKIIQSYEVKDNRIVFLKNSKNLGLIATLNKGISVAKFNIIARMDADDISLPNRLKREYELLKRNPECSLVSTNKIDIDENGKVIKNNSRLPCNLNIIKKVMLCENVIFHPTVMFRKKDFLELGGYRNIFSAEDYDLWLRFLSSGKKIMIINEYLLKYRIRSESISRKNAMKQRYTAIYCRRLYKKRVKCGNDGFSEHELENYINKHCTAEKEKKYIEGYDYFIKAWDEYNSKKYIRCFKHYVKALCNSWDILIRTVDLIKYKYYFRG